MTEFRVTKYDPQMRLPDGRYPVEEWTGVSDIGRTFLGRVFDCNEYLLTEDAYVEAIHNFMNVSGDTWLQIEELEIYADRTHPLLESRLQLAEIENKARVAGPDLDSVARLALREQIWCRLESPSGFFVHFGNDYYMYIGARMGITAPKMPRGIFAEPFLSPYHQDAEEE